MKSAQSNVSIWTWQPALNFHRATSTSFSTVHCLINYLNPREIAWKRDCAACEVHVDNTWSYLTRGSDLTHLAISPSEGLGKRPCPAQQPRDRRGHGTTSSHKPSTNFHMDGIVHTHGILLETEAHATIPSRSDMLRPISLMDRSKHHFSAKIQDRGGR